MAMNYNVRHAGDVTILDLSGRLSVAEVAASGPGSSSMLRDTIRDLIQKGYKKLLLNLAEVTYVDSSGVGQLVSAFTTTRNQGGDLKLLGPTTPVFDLLRTVKLDTIFDIQSNEATAVQSFSREAAANA